MFRTGSGAQAFTPVAYNENAVREHLEQWPLDSTYTILYLGTSQTLGSGASHPQKSMVGQIHATLTARSDRPLASFNASRSGSRSHDLLQLYRVRLADFAPHLVVVNLSNNDPAKTFAEGLRGIVRLSRERGARVLFVLEANTLEYDSKYLRNQHETMKGVAAEAGIPVVDLFAYIADREREDAGFIWRDKVHLSSFGQALAAEAIAAGILEHFGEEFVGGQR